MAELKIMPIVPDDDDRDAVRRKKAPAAPRKARAASVAAREEVEDPAKPEFDKNAVEDEVKRRYGLDKVKVTEVSRSRTGEKSHKTGATRK